MYFYFSSDYPVALKLGGAFFGVLSDGVKHCDIDLSKTTLAEACPLISNQPTRAFLLDENFCGSIDGGSVTDLKGGYLIKFLRVFTGGEFCVLAQEKFPDALVTVFNDGGLKISVETQNDFFAEAVPFEPKSASIERFNSNGQTLFLVSMQGDYGLYSAFACDGKIEKVFCRRGDSCSIENGLTLTESFKDIAKHKTVTRWEYENGTMTEKSRTVTANANFSTDKLTDRLIPYAFLEELLVGGDCTAYLDQTVLANADKLGGYLGEFIGVMPPPLFRDFTEVGLIYKTAENSFTVEYYAFTLSNGKITNIKKTS